VTRNAPGNRLAPVRPKADGLEDDPDEYTIDQPRIAAKSSPRLLGPKVSIIEVQDEQPPARSADFDTEEEDAARRRATSKTLVIRPAANKAASGADDDSWMIDETRSGPRNAAERRGDGVAQVDDDHPLSSLRSRQTRTQAQAGAPAKIASRGATDSANNASPRSQGNVQAFGDPVARPPQRSETYVVVPGDNFWTISRKQYGASRYFAALARHNQERIPDPQRLRPGMQVSTPSASVLEQRYPDLIDKAGAAGSAPIGAPDDRSDGRPMFGQPAASRPGVEREAAAAPQATGVFYGPAGQPMYRIGADDTLSSIAQKHLGRSSRWTEIYEQNRKVLPNPESLTVGTIIRLPADASQVSRGADSVLRR
jgi:nucleoid-associated protein YgaU